MGKEELINNLNDNNDINEAQETNEKNAVEELRIDEVPADEKTEELLNEIKKLEEKANQCDEYFNMLQRLGAEFDNYKKRVAKERETLSKEVTADVVNLFLPVLDNLKRAAEAYNDDQDSSHKEGVVMIIKQFNDVFVSMGVEEIKGVGEKFNPEYHNAVMHIEDDELEENIIVEEFQKGYIFKDKVIRHSMVKVAN